MDRKDTIVKIGDESHVIGTHTQEDTFADSSLKQYINFVPLDAFAEDLPSGNVGIDHEKAQLISYDAQRNETGRINLQGLLEGEELEEETDEEEEEEEEEADKKAPAPSTPAPK